jgi:hypothetical protein
MVFVLCGKHVCLRSRRDEGHLGLAQPVAHTGRVTSYVSLRVAS